MNHVYINEEVPGPGTLLLESQYKAHIENIVGTFKSANSEISIIVQVSTTRGTLDNMKESFSQVAGIVDGVSCGYSNDPVGLNMLGDFVQWFKQNLVVNMGRTSDPMQSIRFWYCLLIVSK
jgi:hypothetical protein